MDEPTKGLDAEFKQAFAAMVRSLLSGGVTVLMVSHDVEFCARYAHRCALFFDGSISAEGTPRAFFGGNSFYTTSADRMARARVSLLAVFIGIALFLLRKFLHRFAGEVAVHGAGDTHHDKVSGLHIPLRCKEDAPVDAGALGVAAAHIAHGLSVIGVA